MSGKELREALLRSYPVRAGGISYKYIKEIIYSKDRQGNVMVSCVCVDRNGNSLTRVRASDVEFLFDFGAPREECAV